MLRMVTLRLVMSDGQGLAGGFLAARAAAGSAKQTRRVSAAVMLLFMMLFLLELCSGEIGAGLEVRLAFGPADV